MNRSELESPINDERIERLICRHLDGEADAAENTELLRLIETDPAARALLDDYAELDARAATALRSHALPVGEAAARPMYRPQWRRVASALGVAAVLMALLVAGWVRSALNPPSPRKAGNGFPAVAIDRPSADTWSGGRDDIRLVDYREVDFQPQVRQRRTASEWIGIPDRTRGDEVIYILERDRHADRIVPVSGDF